MLILSMMDAATKSAMASDANLSKNQLWMIKRYLTESRYGNQLMVPEQGLDAPAGVDRIVPAKLRLYIITTWHS
jgi:hypothetical protein